MRSDYNIFAEHYNITRKADPFITSRLVYYLNPQKGKAYLDIGCGSGNYTIAISGMGFAISGVDPSEKMLKVARERNEKVKWLAGDSEHIPFPDASVDGIIATLTIHHWPDLRKSFLELNRVLSEAGRIVIFTSTPDQMKGYWLNHYFPDMMKSSMSQMPAYNKIEDSLEKAGLKIKLTEKYFVRPDLQDFFLYCGKHDPKRYFDEIIRRGISSFAALSNRNEVESGLQKLSSDISDGSFERIRSSYENDEGDYLFLMVERS